MIPDEASNHMLVENCRRLVSVKYRIDDFLEALRRRRFEPGTDEFASFAIDWLDEIAMNPAVDDDLWFAVHCPGHNRPELEHPYLCAIRPIDFVDCIFPVAATRHYEQGEAVLKSIDSSLIIGGTWYNYPLGIRTEAELDKINARAEAAERGWDTAYAKLEPLPLYEAYEGKNRVRAFQSAGRDISAFTSVCHFPPAGQLMLHDVARSSFPAVSDTTTRKDYVLILPSVTVPLLESYGVPWGPRVSGGLHTRRAWKRERRQIQIKLINSHMLW